MSTLLQEFDEKLGQVTGILEVASEWVDKLNDIEKTVGVIIQRDIEAPGENSITSEKIDELHEKATTLEGMLKYIFASVVKLVQFVFSFFKKDEHEDNEQPEDNGEEGGKTGSDITV